MNNILKEYELAIALICFHVQNASSFDEMMKWWKVGMNIITKYQEK